MKSINKEELYNQLSTKLIKLNEDIQIFTENTKSMSNITNNTILLASTFDNM